MDVRMPKPIKRQSSQFYWLRKRVPELRAVSTPQQLNIVREIAQFHRQVAFEVLGKEKRTGNGQHGGIHSEER